MKTRSGRLTGRRDPEFRRQVKGQCTNREGPLPLCRHRWKWAVSGLPFTFLIILHLCFPILVSTIVPGAAALPAPSPDWSFEPLGPDGADVLALQPVGDEGYLLLTARGALMYWVPSPAGFSDGMWRPVTLPSPERVIRLGVSGRTGRLPVLLLSDGEVLVWEANGSTEIGSERGIAGLPAGSFISRGRLPEGHGLIVSIVPGGTDDHDAVTAKLISQPGEIFLVGTDSITPAICQFRGAGGVMAGAGSFQPDRLHSDRSQLDQSHRRSPRVTGAVTMPSLGRQMYLFTEWEGLFCSYDGGQWFYPVAGGLPKSVRALTEAPGGGLYASGGDGIFASENKGRSWWHVDEKATFIAGEFIQLLADPLNPERLFALTRSGRLLRSENGGRQWDLLLQQIPIRGRQLCWGVNSQELLVATSRGILCSIDGGENWVWRNRGLREVSVLDQAIDDVSGRLLLGTNLGFYFGGGAVNGWQMTLNSDLIDNLASSAGGDHRSRGRCSCETEAAWRCLSGHISTVSLNRTGAYLSVCVGGSEGAVYCDLPRSPEVATSAGSSMWKNFGENGLASSVLATPYGGKWAAGCTGGVSWSGYLDAGSAWHAGTGDARSTGKGSTSRASSFSCSVGDETLCLAVVKGALVFMSPSAMTRLITPAGTRATAVAKTENGLWLGCEQGLYFRPCSKLDTDGAVRSELQSGEDSWIPIAFENEWIISIHVASANHSALVCHTKCGVFLTQNGGQSWESVPMPTEQEIFSLAIAPMGERVYLGTEQGVFAADPPERQPLVLPPLPIVPTPNPFQQHVALRCRLPIVGDGEIIRTDQLLIFYNDESGQAGEPVALTAGETEQLEIRIFGINGQLVRTVFQAEVVSNGNGNYLEWHWDGRTERGQEAPNGIYWAATRVGQQEFAGKVVKFR
jgi:hypothetical protein